MKSFMMEIGSKRYGFSDALGVEAHRRMPAANLVLIYSAKLTASIEREGIGCIHSPEQLYEKKLSHE